MKKQNFFGKRPDLIEHNGSPLHVDDPDVIGPPGVIFDEASYPAAPFVPSLVGWRL